MPTPMWMFNVLAAEYGVDPADEEAVDHFYQKTIHDDMPSRDRQLILTRLLNHDVRRPERQPEDDGSEYVRELASSDGPGGEAQPT